jgi:glycosyltransferase involved in cell wall biosynthesis
MDKGVYGDRMVQAGVSVYTLDMRQSRISIRALNKLYQIISNLKPDIVQTWMYHADLVGGFVARLAGVRCIVWGIRAAHDKGRTSFSTRIVIHLCAFLSRYLPKYIISNSLHAANTHIKLGYVNKKFFIIPNGYNLHQLLPNPVARELLRNKLDLSDNIILIGMVARFNPYKDHENLFRALSAIKNDLPHMICLLVGSGMDAGNVPLMHLIEKHHIQGLVKLLGPRDDIQIIMASLDIHVLSSAGESFPNVVAEAMACGTPCIVTDVGDVAAIVGGTGWIVPSSDPDTLCAAILQAVEEMRDTDRWIARKTACRSRIILNYGIERMVDNYNKVWNAALSA